MKITKMLVLVLTLTLLSCSQDEELKDAQESSLSTIQLKNAGLTQQEVDNLKAQCTKISTSAEFLTMRSSVKTFCDNINNNENGIFVSDRDFAVWLEGNITETNYASVADGLAGLENSKIACETFYSVNRRFFESVSGGTTEQISDILTPITTEPPLTAESSVPCVVGCVIRAAKTLVNIARSYEDDLMIDAEEMQWVRDYVHVAESRRAAGVAALIKAFKECIGGC